ncbi:related to Cleavage stimulation factor [Pseudozyma flocculosa]|uniref:Related to Cleavage stimulation factor n=1 Tax=Pseudozyma flocculosa TaxID=84751 RepID=A0A5C3F2J3_9BASI|nr:related to Cleavage stimulation factor [Pseudozyma flocculosa]
MTNAQRGSRVVFVGNIPYDMSEEQLVEVFSEVGKVVGFRLVNDRDTGKFKGYGFCEFEDPETAASAVRNLNEVDVGGRPLRIDFADIDPLMEGRSTQHGQFDQEDVRRRAALAGRAGRPGTFGHAAAGGGPQPGGAPQWGNRAGRDNGYGDRMQDGGFGGGGPGGFGQQGAPPAGPGGAVLPPNLPTGVPLPPGVGATDAITQTLATLPPNQLLDIMGQMKALTATSPDQARALLTGHPQLAYALFQAMLMMNVVDPAILQRILGASGAVPPAAAAVAAAVPAVAGGPPPPPPTGPMSGPLGYGGPMATGTPPHHPMSQGPPGPPPPMGRPAPAPYDYTGGPSATHTPPGPYSRPAPTPPHGMARPPGVAPPPPPPSAPAGAAGGLGALAGQNLGEEQRQLLMQVLQLTPDQINALPPDQKASIMQLKAQFGQA